MASRTSPLSSHPLLAATIAALSAVERQGGSSTASLAAAQQGQPQAQARTPYSDVAMLLLHLSATLELYVDSLANRNATLVVPGEGGVYTLWNNVNLLVSVQLLDDLGNLPSGNGGLGVRVLGADAGRPRKHAKW